jgi:hypothetical protein
MQVVNYLIFFLDETNLKQFIHQQVCIQIKASLLNIVH